MFLNSNSGGQRANRLRLERNSRHFAGSIIKRIFLNENICHYTNFMEILFGMIWWSISHYNSCNGLAPNRHQAITWTNVDQDVWRYMMSLVLIELCLPPGGTFNPMVGSGTAILFWGCYRKPHRWESVSRCHWKGLRKRKSSRQKGWHVTDGIYKWFFLRKNLFILFQISLMFIAFVTSPLIGEKSLFVFHLPNNTGMRYFGRGI